MRACVRYVCVLYMSIIISVHDPLILPMHNITIWLVTYSRLLAKHYRDANLNTGVLSKVKQSTIC